jgi:hypothetical protein
MEELLVKQIKIECGWNVQELIKSTKKPNMRIMANEEKEGMQAKGI